MIQQRLYASFSTNKEMIVINFYQWRNYSRKVIALVTVVLFVSSLCSCNSSKNIVSSFTDTLNSENGSQKNYKDKDIVITLALSQTDNELMKMIEDFNSADNGYHIEVKTYLVDSDEKGNPISNTNNELISADFRVVQDIINTDDIDIIYNGSLHGGAKYELLKNHGAFVDLYKFMDNDDEVNSSTLDGHILKLNERNGNLYSFPTFYVVNTLVGESRYVGNTENWTVDDFISHWEQMPDNSTVNGSPYAESAYRSVLSRNIETFLDYENHTVRFDSPEFKQILEFCKRFPSSNGDKVEVDYSAPSFVSPYELSGIISAGIFNDGYINSIHETVAYTLVGYPSSDGCGASFADSGKRFSICASSSEDKQHAAWEFIRQFYTYSYQKENVIRYVDYYNGSSTPVFETEAGFCVNKKAFEDTAQEIISGKYYDEMINNDLDSTLIIPVQNDYEQLCRYINSVNKWESRADHQLRLIVDEEVMGYLSGEKDIDTTINLIQNRTSIWISEQS